MGMNKIEWISVPDRNVGVKENQVQVLSDPVTVSMERCYEDAIALISAWEGVTKRWYASQETCWKSMNSFRRKRFHETFGTPFVWAVRNVLKLWDVCFLRAGVSSFYLKSIGIMLEIVSSILWKKKKKEGRRTWKETQKDFWHLGWLYWWQEALWSIYRQKKENL